MYRFSSQEVPAPHRYHLGGQTWLMSRMPRQTLPSLPDRGLPLFLVLILRCRQLRQHRLRRHRR